MAQNEKTSAQVAQIASKAMKNPQSLTPDEVQALAASVLSQSPDRQQGQEGQQGQHGQQNFQSQKDQQNQQKR